MTRRPSLTANSLILQLYSLPAHLFCNVPWTLDAEVGLQTYPLVQGSSTLHVDCLWFAEMFFVAKTAFLIRSKDHIFLWL